MGFITEGIVFPVCNQVVCKHKNQKITHCVRILNINVMYTYNVSTFPMHVYYISIININITL